MSLCCVNGVERIGKTVYEICNEPARNRIKLNEQHTGFIMESHDSTAWSCIGWAIEKHLNDIPSKLKPTFQNILEDTRTRKDNLERS
jgi:hypothetical protein